jgi:hypothetical protein
VVSKAARGAIGRALKARIVWEAAGLGIAHGAQLKHAELPREDCALSLLTPPGK